MKKDSIEADSTFLTWFRRKTSRESECIHCEECTETENISLTAQQAVIYTEKHTFFNENHVMSEHDKRRNNNKSQQRDLSVQDADYKSSASYACQKSWTISSTSTEQ